MKMNKKGFTLIEMLVVIAIIAVLVSIVIPVVGSATEKAREAADAANVRAVIAEITTTALMDGEKAANALAKTVTMTQETKGFVTEGLDNIGGLEDFETVANATKGTTLYFGWANDKVTVSTTAPTVTPAPEGGENQDG